MERTTGPLTPDAIVQRLSESHVRVVVQEMPDGDWVLSPDDPTQLRTARELLMDLFPGVSDVSTPEENSGRIYFRVAP